MLNVRRTAPPSDRSPRHSSPAAWWFGSAALAAAVFVLLFYVQLVHAAVERGALARAALPLPSTSGRVADDASDPFGPEARRSAVRTVRALRATPTPIARGERRLVDRTL